jgi:hypothetical protein
MGGRIERFSGAEGTMAVLIFPRCAQASNTPQSYLSAVAHPTGRQRWGQQSLLRRRPWPAAAVACTAAVVSVAVTCTVGSVVREWVLAPGMDRVRLAVGQRLLRLWLLNSPQPCLKHTSEPDRQLKAG